MDSMPNESVVTWSHNMTNCRWVAPVGRGKAISTIYAASSAGTVLGLMATPVLAQLMGGWPACFLFFAALGIAWAVSVCTAMSMKHTMLTCLCWEAACT